MISHEFRTPLATIQSSSDLLERYNERLTEEQKTEHLHKIQGQVQNLTTMLEDILTVSRSETLELEFNPEWIDLESLCQEVVTNMRMIADQHTILLSIKGVASHVFLDPKLMQQVVTNLLSNAIKYSSPGSNVWVGLSRDQDGITIRVQDEGIGIPEKDKKYLFEVYHRANNVKAVAGTGLGLAIVKRAVERHNGTIAVESKIGIGTTFTLQLPVPQPAS
jgi:signal transduction histidine kinase